MKLSECVKRVRKDRGLTQNQMSKNIGVSRSYISQIENNRYNMSSQTVFEISKLYNVTFICNKDGWDYKDDDNV